jgi:hypothetical protein
MSTVIMHAVVSVDGFIADDNDEVGPLFDWYFNGDHPLQDDDAPSSHPRMPVSERSYGYVKPFWDSITCSVVGRHLFDLTNGWEAKPPACDELVVVSHPDVVLQGDRVLHLRYPVRR